MPQHTTSAFAAADTRDDTRSHLIPHALVVGNGKGGVGKTTTASHLAAFAAHSGWRVLVVDADPQGNQSRDFGFRDDSDFGEGLSLALKTGDPQFLKPLVNVRPNLDVIPGGLELEEADKMLSALIPDNPDISRRLGHVLQGLAEDYQLVVIDTAPASGSTLPTSAFACAGNLLIPTRPDAASIDGLEPLAARIGRVRASHNPVLRVLAVLIFDLGRTSTDINRRARADLHEVLRDEVPVLNAYIRKAEKAPFDMRELGLTAIDYEQKALNAKPGPPQSKDEQTYAKNASGLAQDWEAASTEILSLFLEPHTL